MALYLLSPLVNAGPYTLIPGDRIEVTYIGQGRPETVFVDVDGEVRLPSIGGVSVTGKTLSDAEEAIAAAVNDAGLYVDPVVSMTLLEYAPIIVSGDVSQPGRFVYLPGTTIASALALSGGGQPTGVSRFEVDRARVEVEGQLRTLNLDIAATVVDIARLEATLGNLDTLMLPPELRAVIPAPGAVPLENFLTAGQEILSTDRARAAEALEFWDEEILIIETQSNLFDQRINVQQEIVATVAEDLENARTLQERGLQTSARLIAAEQRTADAKSRQLEFESAKVAATRAIGDARRDRAQFIATRRENNLRALKDASVALQSLRLRHARQSEQLNLLGGGSLGTLLAAEAINVEFTLIRNRPEAETPSEPLMLETPLLPGDTLIVQIELAQLN